MSILELKTNIHKIIEEIESEQLLQSLYNFLQSKSKNKDGELWNSLTEKQKNEVLLAFEESENDDLLINSNDVIN